MLFSFASFAQSTSKKTKLNRAADHFMLQLGSNFWSGTPDSVKDYVNGFNRSVNAYVMLDKPFRGNNRMSVAAGLGIGTSNIYFDHMETRITAFSPTLPFVRTDTGRNYKKYKLTTAYVEIPLELRFIAKPLTPNKSIKAAIGVKGGILVDAHTKGKNLQSASGSSINGFTFKEKSKSYFNGNRIAATARVGYGIFTLFGTYGLTSVFKDGVAADIKSVQIGLTISGL